MRFREVNSDNEACTDSDRRDMFSIHAHTERDTQRDGPQRHTERQKTKKQILAEESKRNAAGFWPSDSFALPPPEKKNNKKTKNRCTAQERRGFRVHERLKTSRT